jgi:hypothetical protein
MHSILGESKALRLSVGNFRSHINGYQCANLYLCIKKCIPTFIIAMAALIVLMLWLSDGNAWIHNELVYLPQHMRSILNSGSFWEQLKTVFEWNIFDPCPDRLRPLSDFIEVIDVILRTKTMVLFGLNSSLTVSALFLAILTGFFLFKSVRLLGLSKFYSALFVLLLLTSIGYLSCFIPYIRPAKKLGLFFTATVVFFIFQFLENPKRNQLLLLFVFLFFSFFADESGYALYLVALIFLIPSLLRYQNYKGALCLFFLPILYFLIAKTVLPILYMKFGHAGPRNGASIQLLSRMFSYLLEPSFYVSAFTDMSKCSLATIGNLNFESSMLQKFLMVFLFIFGFSLFKSIKTYNDDKMNIYKFIFLLSLSLMGLSFSLSLFDWFNTPFGYNNIGVYGYYYHSPVCIIVLLWLAAILKASLSYASHLTEKNLYLKNLLPGISVILILIISTFNVKHFQTLNQMIQILHYYPIDIKSFSPKSHLSIVSENNKIIVKIPSTPEKLKAEYQKIITTTLKTGGESFLGLIERYEKTTNVRYFLGSVEMFFPTYTIEQSPYDEQTNEAR